MSAKMPAAEPATTPTDPGAPARHAPAGSRGAPGRRPGRRAGSALRARGESMIWLTGGSLVFCLIMVVGLLGLVFYQGFSTFWPQPLVQVRLAQGKPYDGAVYLGEVFREEDYELTGKTYKTFGPEIRRRLRDRFTRAAPPEGTYVPLAGLGAFTPATRSALRGIALPPGDWTDYLRVPPEAFETLPEPVRKEARPHLLAGYELVDRAVPDDKAVTVHRRLMRTGNFDLTSTHFHWVPDFAVAPDGEQLPPHALVIERLTWGRFYGLAESFVLRTVLEPDPAERTLGRLRVLFGTHDKEFTPAEKAEIADLLPRAEAQRRQRAWDRTTALRAKLRDTTAPEVLAKLSTGQTVPLADVTRDQPVAQVHEVWTGAEPAWRQYTRHHEEVARGRDAVEELKKGPLRDLNRRQERARLAVRDMEIEFDLLLLPDADKLAEQIALISAQEKARDDEAARLAGIAEMFPEPDAALIRKLAAIGVRAANVRIAESKARAERLRGMLNQRPEQARRAVEQYASVKRDASRKDAEISGRIVALNKAKARYELHMATIQGQTKALKLADIVRAYPANEIRDDWWAKMGVYGSRWWEYLSDEPREANSEGGVWPAIFGTVLMTLLMCVAVVPFGVLAALYLREYAKAGAVVSAVRIAINNLAGVPSIVFGVFGLGFFCYGIGKFVDTGSETRWSPSLWWAGLAELGIMLVAVILLGISATGRHEKRAARHNVLMVAGLATLLAALAGPMLAVQRDAFGLRTFLGAGWSWGVELACGVGGLYVGWILACLVARRSDPDVPAAVTGAKTVPVVWFLAVGLVILLVAKMPWFHGFYRAHQPNPVFGKSALLWASATLALLTLPVVIVATEEALAAVPNSMREGSYACGGSKWQTVRRIVLPRAMPGILTGTILAMARGAGEVAPLMLVGAVKYTPELPLRFTGDVSTFFGFPWGFNNSFMHLGFHIYDVGFQSQNSEAARPMVFTTTLLLILIVVALNLAAIWLRSRLRRRFVTSQF